MVVGDDRRQSVMLHLVSAGVLNWAFRSWPDSSVTLAEVVTVNSIYDLIADIVSELQSFTDRFTLNATIFYEVVLRMSK